MSKKIFIICLAAALSCGIFSCSKEDGNDDSSFNLFSVDDDIAFGRQLDSSIMADPASYPILSRTQYPQAYAHLGRIRDNILNSGKVFYKDRFEWKLTIIQNDSVLNAFAAPGGYIYIYTGIIKYLDSEYQLAGVLGHEMAHADRRHSTDQISKAYGIQLMLDLLLGNNQSMLTEIAAGLATLKFSRTAETEADEYSVIYLCPTEYQADGAAGFFEKLESSGNNAQPPVFLSTHPNPGDRVVAIKNKKTELNCAADGVFVQRYQDFKNSLP
jgi:predicted Zn-dependent protease